MVTENEGATDLEGQIALWRGYLGRRQAVRKNDVEELEGHLRDQIEALRDAGLDPEEAFLVAVKRLGNLDAVAHEFAREHSDRLWKQLVLAPDPTLATDGRSGRIEIAVMLGFAVAAAVAIKLPELFGYRLDDGEGASFYARNLSLFVLPFLTGYFAWRRRLTTRTVVPLAAAFLVAGAVVNLYPLIPGGSSVVLTAIHLPIALWLVVGVAYAGGEWRSDRKRMDFVRFSGEWFIYYTLIALGGGVLIGFTMLIFEVIDVDASLVVFSWVLPCGAMGAVVVAAWLVEAKQGILEAMAPVLTRIFTPLFAVVLLVFLATLLVTGRGFEVDRVVLIGFDLLLVLVLGLVLYAVSSRDPEAKPGFFDGLQLVLVVSALLIDVLALVAITSRIQEFGLSPNKVAALGENLVLLVNLGGAAWLYWRFLGGVRPFRDLERWQTAYLPVFALWAAVVAIVFPLAFDFM